MSITRLIADVGGTSSRWILMKGEEQFLTIKGPGFNPYVSSNEVLIDLVKSEVLPKIEGQPDEVHYYGAGCGRSEFQRRVHTALNTGFTGSAVHVESDLVGAGRALLGRKPGLAIILGTGMNAGYFDEGELVDGIPSIGYLLGDEGSGKDFGKHFLSAWYWKKLPTDVWMKFREFVGMHEDELLRSIYEDPTPNKKIASYTSFISQHIDNEQVRDLVKGRFFVLLNMLKEYYGERGRSIGVVGSVGFYFNEVLKEAAADLDLSIVKVIADPLEDIVAFHSAATS